MKNFIFLLGGLVFASLTINSCTKKGCTNPSASNYDKNADKEDGSCKNFTKFRFGEIRVDKIPTTNINGGVWDNTSVEFQNPDVFIRVEDQSGNFVYSSNLQYDNQFPSSANPFNFDMIPATNTTDFNQIFTLYILDNDEFSADVIAQKQISLVELTDITSSNKFPNSVSINTLNTEATIRLIWSE